MPRPATITKGIDVTERARFYGVCEKTITRWIKAGVDVRDLEAVGDHILRQRTPSHKACRTIHHQLSTL